jgi:aminoglycoside phosphotransferase
MTLSQNEIPAPYDLYDPAALPSGMDAFLAGLVLSVYPPGPGVRILDSQSYRPGYMEFPVRVRVQVHTQGGDGKEEVCVLKAGRVIGEAEREAALLPVLARVGLPAPRLLAGPVLHPDYPGAGPFIVISELPGKPLPWIEVNLEQADLGCRLLFQGVERLHQLTPALRGEAAGSLLEEKNLLSELQGIRSRGGPWFDQPLFSAAIERLVPVLAGVQEELVFSNGDYNPENFLYEDHQLTGWIDFGLACFEDPYVGFAKFIIWGFDSYGWGTGVKTGLVERYLYAHNLARVDFAPRLALRCLWRLQREISVSGEADAVYRQAVLKVLEEALKDIN